MATKRLTENHPFMGKVNKLYDLLTEMGISIECNGMGGLSITDTISNRTYHLKDLDGGELSSEFPTLCEFKLTIEV